MLLSHNVGKGVQQETGTPTCWCLLAIQLAVTGHHFKWCSISAAVMLYAIVFMQSCCIIVHEPQRVSTERVDSHMTLLPHFGSGTGGSCQDEAYSILSLWLVAQQAAAYPCRGTLPVDIQKRWT